MGLKTSTRRNVCSIGDSGILVIASTDHGNKRFTHMASYHNQLTGHSISDILLGTGEDRQIEEMKKSALLAAREWMENTISSLRQSIDDIDQAIRKEEISGDKKASELQYFMKRFEDLANGRLSIEQKAPCAFEVTAWYGCRWTGVEHVCDIEQAADLAAKSGLKTSDVVAIMNEWGMRNGEIPRNENT